jgi:diguanylate cyclase (GGDEF)-like protein
MKQEKDSRITAPSKSLKYYLLIFLTLATFNTIEVYIVWTFIEKGMLITYFHMIFVFRVLFVLIYTAVLTLVFGFFREFLLEEPLRKLGAAARQIAKGDFSVRIAPRRKDGKKDFVDVLFDDFNRMTDELAIANEKLKALATTDELTKLDNRRSFLERIDLVWKQNHRLSLPITILMIDIDYFKKYNDSLGHLEGDKALVAIAQCIKSHAKRKTDFVARFGGEEFVCLLPFIEKDNALIFAKKLVQKVEDMKIPHPMGLHSKYVTISVGVASDVPNDNKSYTQLLDEADKALYSAKDSGRNRAVAYANGATTD